MKILKRLLYFWTLFIGIGALFGGIAMLISPSGKLFGMEGFIPSFQVLPLADILFQNLVFPGIALIIVNGLSQLFAFYLLKTSRKGGSAAALVCGILLMLWICIQFIIFPLNFMSTAYFIFGLLEAVAAFLLLHTEAKR